MFVSIKWKAVIFLSLVLFLISLAWVTQSIYQNIENYRAAIEQNQKRHQQILDQLISDNYLKLSEYAQLIVDNPQIKSKKITENSHSIKQYLQDKWFAWNLNIGIDEAVDSVSDNNLEAVILLTNLRHQWVQMVSSYRMYLINRLATMDIDSLNQQVANTKVFIRSINQSFAKLKSLKKKSKLGFQISDSLSRLEKAAAIWIKNYETVIATNTMEEWRAD